MKLSIINYQLKTAKGFTLIELLIAAAIMALLSAVTVANFKESEKNKSLTATADTIINAVRNGQNKALASEAIAGSSCVVSSVSDRSPKSYLVFFASPTSATLYGIDKCDNAIALETYLYSTNVIAQPNGYAINGTSAASLQVKFTTPFAQMTASSSGSVNQGAFAGFTASTVTVGISGKTRTVTVDGISGKVE